MSALQSFILIATAHFLALLSPGPDFLLILATSTRHGSRAGVRASAGIALANGVYIAVALAGVSALARSPALLSALGWGGAAYLAWLGAKLLSAKAADHPASSAADPAADTAVFRAGFLSGLLNPKNMLFYFSLFSLGAEQGSALTRTGYGLWMFTVVFCWDAWLARSLGRGRLHQWFNARQRKIERGCGALFVLLAAGLALGARGA
ncbi:LysE family translocator [Niveibacterium terrae]|uniref:LysE family translocator n=1 Tax=Niveibacterium terrae TaxID=3373598 RepID=UPI003A95CFC6